LCTIRVVVLLDRRPKGDLAERWDFKYALDAFPSLCDFTKLKKFTTNMNTLGEIFFGPSCDDSNEEEANAKRRRWIRGLETGAPLDGTTEKFSDFLPHSLEELVIQRLDMREDADTRYDYRQLDHLVTNRLHSLPNLKRITYVCATGTHPFDEHFLPPITQNANSNVDEFLFDVSSSQDWLRKTRTPFFTADKRKCVPTQYVRWKGDRYFDDVEEAERMWRLHGGRAGDRM
jgi:hypothetical protein